MGNQIVCPSGQSWYMSDVEKMGYKVERSLFDGTFLLSYQVTEIKTNKKYVIKGYNIPDNDTQYKEIRSASLEAIQLTQELLTTFNSKFANIRGNIPHNIVVNTNAAYMIRPYLRTDLANRLDDYPKLNLYERLWIAYQLCQSVVSLHENGVYHGALKPDNVLLTTRLQVKIADLSPYKPEILRVNQPNFYLHYFSCFGCAYIAPERLVDSDSSSGIDPVAADLFSLGCIIAYIFLDGNDLFDFGSVVSYKSGDQSVFEKIAKISDEKMRNLVTQLISLNGKERLVTMMNFKEFFPKWIADFYDCFYQYNLESDDISMLVNNHQHIMKILPPDINIGSFVYFNVLSAALIECDENFFFDKFVDHYVEYILQYFDDEKKLTRAIPPLFELIERQAIIAIYAWRGILQILRSVKAVPESLRGYHTSFIFKRLNLVRSTEFAFMVLTDIPLFAIEMSKIFPTFLTDLHELEPLFSQLCDLSPSLRNKMLGIACGFLLNCQKASFSGSFELLDIICQFTLFLVTIDGILPKIVDMIISFYQNFDSRARTKFMSKLLEPIVNSFSSVEFKNQFGSQNIFSLIKFIKEIPINPIDYVIFYDIAVSCASRGTYLDRAAASELIDHLGGRYKIAFAGEFVTDLVYETDKSPDDDKKRPPARAKYSGTTFVPNSKGEWPMSAFFTSARVSQDEPVRYVFSPNNDMNFISLVGKSQLSSITLQVAEPHIKKVSAMVFKEPIFDMEKISTGNIMFSTNNSIYVMNSIQDINKAIDCKQTITKIRQADGNSILTHPLNMELIEIRDMNTLDVVSQIQLDKKIKCFDTYFNNPFIPIATESNIYVFDKRINLPVWTTEALSPTRYLVSVQNSGFAAVCEEAVYFYDMSSSEPIIKICGVCSCVSALGKHIFALNQSGTFVIDTLAPTHSFELYDNKPAKDLKVSNRATSFSVILSDKYMSGLHGHMHRVTCADLNENICASGDEKGIINFWAPKRTKAIKSASYF